MGARLESLFALCLGLGLGSLLASLMNGPGSGSAPSHCHCDCDCRTSGRIDIGSEDLLRRTTGLLRPVIGSGASLPQDSLLVALPPAPGNGSLISADNLIVHADSIMNRINTAKDTMGPQDCGAAFADAIPLLGMADLAQVDVMLESGTAGGRSAEFMARFFQGTHVQVITLDLGIPSVGGRCAAHVEDAHKRLKAFANVQASIGDSFKLFPKLIQKHEGKRIGLFIDGPKGHDGIKLCMASIKQSTDVKFCAFHDVRPGHCAKHGETGDAYEFLGKWGRLVVRTCCWERWLKHFDLKYCSGSSLGIIAGQDTFPLGVVGDF